MCCAARPMNAEVPTCEHPVELTIDHRLRPTLPARTPATPECRASPERSRNHIVLLPFIPIGVEFSLAFRETQVVNQRDA